MGISDRIRGKKNVNGGPHVDAIIPAAALPGGEVRITGAGLRTQDAVLPRILFGEDEGAIVISADDFVVARVPEGVHSCPVVISSNEHSSNPVDIKVGVPIAENLHPVANPAVDESGNVYVTFSGPRGQRVPVAVYKIDSDYNVRPLVTDLMNATGIALGRDGYVYISSRHTGTVYRASANGAVSVYAEGMGVATGLAFDKQGSLYVGDRSGTIFKINSQREIFVFATLEPSVAAYHLAFGPDDNLYVSGPTTSSFDAVYTIDPQGKVTEFYRGLGRPQGCAFDAEGNLYVCASMRGKRGIVRIDQHREASLAVSGHGIVGLAFAPGGALIITTGNAVHYLAFGIKGRPLYG
jgi:sugar lactone lactonase YvrE